MTVAMNGSVFIDDALEGSTSVPPDRVMERGEAHVVGA
jgi:hypothetical protein